MKPAPAEHVAQRRDFHDRLAAAGLAEWSATLDALLKPAIALRTKPSAGHVVGATRVGGEPDLPEDVDWPEGESGPLLFVMQVRLADVTHLDPDELLPSDGHLLLFCDRYVDELRALHLPGGATLVRHAWVPLEDEAFIACDVDVLAELHPPSLPEALPQDLRDAYADQVWRPWYEQARAGRTGEVGIHQLLGYAAFTLDTGEQSPDDEVLFGFDSDDRAGMEWGDGQRIWAILPRAALRARAWDGLHAVV
jgi:uncharacterized protein YwqG